MERPPKRRHADRDESGAGDRDRQLPPTAGALGNERARKRPQRSKEDKAKTRDEPTENAPAARNVRPAFKDTPLPARSNPVGQPDLEARSDLGIKSRVIKSIGPWVTNNLNSESFIHFVLHSSQYEWIKLKSDAISLVIYMDFANQNYVAAEAPNAATVENGNQYINTRTRVGGIINLMVDPDVAGRGFFTRVDVSINNVPVPTNHCIGPLFNQYPRWQAIHAWKDPNEKTRGHFVVRHQLDFNAANTSTPLHRAATEPFDFVDWKRTDGRRIVVPLDGIFPFSMKSQIHQTLENVKEEDLYLPPDTVVEVKLYYHRLKTECIWHDGLAGAPARYWGNTIPAAPRQYRLSVQSAALEYESIELFPLKHAALMEKFRRGMPGRYDFDIPRGQHQSIAAGQSFTENTFQIHPYARTLIVAFLPDHACFVQEAKRRPLTGFSTFPANCSKMYIEYANNRNLICESYVNFGLDQDSQHISKHMVYNYLKKNRCASNFSFEDLFPDGSRERVEGDKKSLVQEFVFDLRHMMSEKTQLLRIGMEFVGADGSPAQMQIAVVSVHPNGRANVRNAKDDGFDWIWEFPQSG